MANSLLEEEGYQNGPRIYSNFGYEGLLCVHKVWGFPSYNITYLVNSVNLTCFHIQLILDSSIWRLSTSYHSRYGFYPSPRGSARCPKC